MSRRRCGGVPGDALAAGLAGAACSAIPSTVWSLVRGDDVLEGGRGAGAMLLPHERRTAVLLVAATPVHLAISMGWAAVLATALPRGREPAWGVVGGMLIGTLDLALIGRRIASIRTLPQGANGRTTRRTASASGWFCGPDGPGAPPSPAPRARGAQSSRGGAFAPAHPNAEQRNG